MTTFRISPVKRFVAGAVVLLGIAGALYWSGSERPAVDGGGEVALKTPDPRGQARAEAGAVAGARADPAGTRAQLLWQAVDERSVIKLPFFAEEWSPGGAGTGDGCGRLRRGAGLAGG